MIKIKSQPSASVVVKLFPDSHTMVGKMYFMKIQAMVPWFWLKLVFGMKPEMYMFNVIKYALCRKFMGADYGAENG